MITNSHKYWIYLFGFIKIIVPYIIWKKWNGCKGWKLTHRFRRDQEQRILNSLNSADGKTDAE